MGAAQLGAGFLAGVLSTLSPCVLPILPLVVGGALAAHRLGALALAAGLAVSFTAIGLFVATIGVAIGLDAPVFRDASAVLLAALGIVLLSGALQRRFATATGGAGNAANAWLNRLAPTGLAPAGPAGQALIGLALGAVWSPCVGPTLGAASLLAAQGENLAAVAAVMFAFGLGAASPLLLVSVLSRQAMTRWRGTLLSAGTRGKTVFGGLAIGIAALILTGFDHTLEAAAVAASPTWLTDVTTRF